MQMNTLDKLIRDSYKLTFKHTVKADYRRNEYKRETPTHGDFAMMEECRQRRAVLCYRQQPVIFMRFLYFYAR